ncbi:hypothetical protein ACROYT_G037645 [Oculina patagonica]
MAEQSFSNSSAASKLFNALLISYVGNSVLNVLLSFTATFGNIVIGISLRKISSLHAPSKALYLGLALSDLGVGLIGHPLYLAYLLAEMNSKGESSNFYKALYATHNVLSVFLCAVSLLTMTAISVDRLLALRLKFRYRETVTLRRVTMTLVFSYILSAVMSSAYFWNYPLYLGATYGGIFLCALISSICCILVYSSIRKQSTRQVFHQTDRNLPSLREHKRNTEDYCFNMASYKRSFYSTLYVYASLSICYLPYVCLKIIGRYTGWDDNLSAAFYWCGTLVLFNSSLNPLLYCWRIQGIRQAAKDTLKSIFCCLK